MPAFSLGEIAILLDGEVHGDSQSVVSGVASLSRATVHQLAYLDNPARTSMLNTTQARAVLVTDGLRAQCSLDCIVVANPFLAMVRAIKLFSNSETYVADVHPTARLSPTATCGSNVSIGAFSIIGDNVQIEDNVSIGANCVIESEVDIGAGSKILHSVVIHKGSRIGQKVNIESGAVIAASPFNPMKEEGEWHAGPAIGSVVLSSRCQIGANTVIDRGTVNDTVLEAGVFLDNLIQVGHDVYIGQNSAVAGCVAIGAHATIGKDCIVGGASTIGPNVELGNEVVITGMSTVNKSIYKPGMYASGTTVSEHCRWRKNAARFKRLDDYVQRLKKLEHEQTSRKVIEKSYEQNY